MKDINKEVLNCPETVFDSFDLRIDTKFTGHALRDRMVELTNLYGRINQLASNALLLYQQAQKRREVVETRAWNEVSKELKVTQQKIAVRTLKITIDDRETTLNDEDTNLILYEYVYNRAKDKSREISAVLDVGRTILSWDKTEQEKGKYD
jgi:hypothetical protein